MERAIRRIIFFYRRLRDNVYLEEDATEGLFYLHKLFTVMIEKVENLDINILKKGERKGVWLHKLREALMLVEGGLTTKKEKNKIVALDTSLHYIHALWRLGDFDEDFKIFRKRIRARHWLKGEKNEDSSN